MFALDADRAFPGAKDMGTIEEFCVLAEQAAAEPAFFDEPGGGNDQGFERQGEWLKFPSDVATDVEQNNVVWAKITDSGSLDRVLVIFHHWNASAWNSRIASFFSKRGVTVIEIAMPYHFQRSRPGSSHADYMLSANLGRTIQSVRQAVLDGRKLIRWLKREGYRDISVLGMSLPARSGAAVMSPRPLLTLYTTLTEFERLHERHDRTRSTSSTVTVDREALIHILMDHANMLNALRKVGKVDVRDSE